MFNDNGIKTKVGTPNYIAPEIVTEEKYNEKCDLWSIGAILYVMLAGKPLFVGKSNKATLDKVTKGKINLTGPNWEKKTDECKEFLMALLNRDPEERLSAQEALQHEWIQSKFEGNNLKRQPADEVWLLNEVQNPIPPRVRDSYQENIINDRDNSPTPQSSLPAINEK